jgi:hypothetical protein
MFLWLRGRQPFSFSSPGRANEMGLRGRRNDEEKRGMTAVAETMAAPATTAATGKTITSEELAELQAVLDAYDGDPGAQCEALTRLCPCRSRWDDPDVWRSILHAQECSPDPKVRHQAEHAVDTLRIYARTNPHFADLAGRLDRETGSALLSPPLVKGKLTSKDVPHLIEVLEGDDAGAQCDALHHLCPCRNRSYDTAAWAAVFRAFEETENAAVRDGAHHAIDTLKSRLRTDPRSQDLVRQLAAASPTAAMLANAVPEWNPRAPVTAKGLPTIPRFERGRRSRKNKPRR